MDIVLKEGFVSQEDFDDARRHEKTENISGLEYLLENNVLSLDLVGQAVAEYYEVPYADLNTKGVVAERVLKLPEKVARKYRAVVFDEDDATVTLATSDPDNSEMAKNLLWFFDQKKIRFAYAMDADIEKAFLLYKKKFVKTFLGNRQIGKSRGARNGSGDFGKRNWNECLRCSL